ncbi:uncharacterized protein [Onthophagus taurus]|uniref:uncharacterized protein n=1 Tax=Onthophagus taurus TaxID=166361 RepID=UPI000C200DFF|nr:formin-like protein 3 [Onthophagus taurus]
MKDTTSNNSNIQTKKPTYKDYQNFLLNYDEQTKNGMVISPASSSSSIQSEQNDVTTPKTYNQYLQNYGNKKFGSVRLKKENVLESLNDQIDGGKKIVRSELVININPTKNVSVKSPIMNRSPEIRVSPKPDNSGVPDHLIYAKSAVLEELLSKSPTLKKPNTTSNIYKRLEQFTLQNESKSSTRTFPPKLPSTPPPQLPQSNPPPIPKTLPPTLPKLHPPSLPTSPTPMRVELKKSISNGPPSPKPPIPQKNFLISELNNEGKKIYIPPAPPINQLNQINNQKMLSNTRTVVPVTDGNAEVDKNDPNVKKLIYNTYRGMLGAYNNKANNMVSTLPRNFVVQDKGVAKQLESINAQGCLSNLNGRVNPNPED